MGGAKTVGSYLREHRAWCEGCGYDLSGLHGPSCPECGEVIRLPRWYVEGEPDPVAAFVAFAQTHDIRCKHCRQNMRGVGTNRCPECGATYQMQRGMSEPTVWMGDGHRRSRRGGALLVLAVMVLVLSLGVAFVWGPGGVAGLVLALGLGLLGVFRRLSDGEAA